MSKCHMMSRTFNNLQLVKCIVKSYLFLNNDQITMKKRKVHEKNK